MIDFTVKGAIFDVDDTLLDNEPGLAEDSLHARSRLAAIREAGIRHKIPSLAHLSREDNLRRRFIVCLVLFGIFYMQRV